MNMTSIIAPIFVLNLVTVLAVIGLKRDSQQGMGYGQFILHDNSYLDVPKLRSENITDLQDCAISCVVLPKCLSYNVASTSTNGKYLCEILDTDISSQCTSNPCQSPKTCIPNYNDGSFKCVTPEDCVAAYKAGKRLSGVYTVDPDGKGAMNVYCDMVTDGGLWTVIQRMIDGSTSFYRNWDRYKDGFGSLSGEFWLGNENIHRLTSSGKHELRVELEDWDGKTAFAKYGTFDVGDESSQYNLTVSSYSGTAGDSLTNHNGMRFSTKDRDNDLKKNGQFAQVCEGAWWYKHCHKSNLNGRYLGNVVNNKGINWLYWKNNRLSMKSAEMKIRHV